MKGNDILRRSACLIAVLVFGFMILTGIPSHEKVMAENVAIMSISPDKVIADVGDTFEVEIIVDTSDAESIASECKLHWQPTGIIECTGIVAGDKYDDFDGSYMGPEGADAIDNVAGSFTDIIGIFATSQATNFQDPVGPTGSGTLFHISFKALQDGIVNLTLSDVTIGNNTDAYPSDQFSTTVVNNGKVYVGNVEEEKTDLTVTSLLADWITTDTSYEVNFEIKNEGGMISEACQIAVYIDDQSVKELDCPELDSDEVFTATTGPFNLNGDSDTIKVFADSDEIIEEGDEENNYLEITWAKGDSNLPDLVVENLAQTWTIRNETYTISFDIANQGNAPSVACKVEVAIDGQPVKTVDCPALEAGVNQSFTAGPFEISGESDDVKVSADAGGLVEEADETNNGVSGMMEKGGEGQPDLVVRNLALDWVAEDETYEVSYEVFNQGTAPSEACKVSVSIDGQEEASQDCPAIIGGESFSSKAGPFEISSDSDDVKVFVDIEFVVSEADETNNNASKTLNKGKKDLPDLLIRNLDQNWITLGESYEVSFDLVNEGTAFSDNCLVQISIDGVEMATIECPGLDIQERYSRQAGPFELSGDSDVIRITVESDENPEANVNNNTVESTLRDMRAFSPALSRGQGLTIAWEYVGVIIVGIFVGGIVLIILLRR